MELLNSSSCYSNRNIPESYSVIQEKSFKRDWTNAIDAVLLCIEKEETKSTYGELKSEIKIQTIGIYVGGGLSTGFSHSGPFTSGMLQL